MSREVRRTGSFVATDDGGRQYTVNIFTEIERVTSTDGIEEVEGRQQLRLANGDNVSRISKGEYETVGWQSQRLHSTDANAP